MNSKVIKRGKKSAPPTQEQVRFLYDIKEEMLQNKYPEIEMKEVFKISDGMYEFRKHTRTIETALIGEKTF